MKKRILSMILALAMLFTTGCSGSDAGKKAGQNETEAEPTAQAEPVAPIKPEATTAPTEPKKPELLDVTKDMYIPFLKSVGEAALAGVETTDDNTAILVYKDADEKDLELFVTLCTYCGLFRYGGIQENGMIQYYLLRPDSDYIGGVALIPETGEMIFETQLEDVLALEEKQMEELSDYYLQDLVLPSDYGPNVHPEFFASIGRTGADSTGLVDNKFGNEPAKCWREVYSKVTYPTLHQYLSDMILCGFDIWYDFVEFEENGVLDTAVFCLENGSSSLLIVYYAGSEMVTVFYQPGVDRYLLKNADYAKYMPQK